MILCFMMRGPADFFDSLERHSFDCAVFYMLGKVHRKWRAVLCRCTNNVYFLCGIDIQILINYYENRMGAYYLPKKQLFNLAKEENV